MRYHERLNIIFMRDNGPRHSIRLRRSFMYLAILFFTSMPFLCFLLGLQCWRLWEENVELRANVSRFETDYQSAVARAERLENLEELLREENVPAREIVLKNLAVTEKKETNISDQEMPPTIMPEGPGHEEFPAIDTERVKVSNVQARIIKGGNLRLGLDLANQDNGKLLSGTVRATLAASNGENYPLVFQPEDVGNFRINRFKRTVMTAKLPPGGNPVNSEIILEVTDDGGAIIYRNIFAVQGQ